MTWHAIHDEATGRLVSVASVVPAAKDRPAGLTYVPLAARPADDDLWDEATRAFASKRPPPPPPPDPADEVIVELRKTETVGARLETAIRAAITAVRTRGREVTDVTEVIR